MTEAVALGAATLPRIVQFETPRYARRYTKRICHLGIGRFHRAHLADYLHRLLQDGHGDDWGLCAIGLRAADRPVIDALRAQDGLYSLWETDGGTPRGRIVGSIMDCVDASEDPGAALAMLVDAATRIVSLTVTEAGYCLDGRNEFDERHADIVHDLAHATQPRSAPGLIVRALALRRVTGLGGFTLLSCDNLIENGRRLRVAVLGFANRVDPALAQWIAREVRFPCSMVDRITPAAAPEREQALCAQAGIADAIPVLCEDWQQWIVEDDFVGGRPAFERVGAVWSPHVAAYEKLKVGLLNGGHSALSHVGLMQGHTRVHDAAADPLVRRWLDAYMQEVAEALDPPPGLDVAAYRASLLRRFANPAIDDRLLRLAQDTSTKYQQSLLPPLRRRLERGRSVHMLALAVALWIQYLARLNDDAAARADYQDVAKDRLLPLARTATQRFDARAFLAAALPLPPQQAAHRFGEKVEHHLCELLSHGTATHLQATLRGA